MAPWRRRLWAAACLAAVACGERRPAASGGAIRFVELPVQDAAPSTPGASPSETPASNTRSPTEGATASSSPTARDLGPDIPVEPLESRDPQRDLAELVSVIEHLERAHDLETLVTDLGARGDSVAPGWIEIRPASPRIVSARARADGTSLLVEVELFESIPGALVERELGPFEFAYVLGEFEDAVAVFRRTRPAPSGRTLVLAVEANRTTLVDATVHRVSFTRRTRSR